MRNEATEQIRVWEQQLVQKAQEYLALLQPIVQDLGIQVQVYMSHSEPASTAHYKSSMDVRFVDEQGQILWMDSLIVYMNWERWAEASDVLPFIQGAFREALHSWRLRHGK